MASRSHLHAGTPTTATGTAAQTLAAMASGVRHRVDHQRAAAAAGRAPPTGRAPATGPPAATPATSESLLGGTGGTAGQAGAQQAAGQAGLDQAQRERGRPTGQSALPRAGRGFQPAAPPAQQLVCRNPAVSRPNTQHRSPKGCSPGGAPRVQGGGPAPLFLLGRMTGRQLLLRSHWTASAGQGADAGEWAPAAASKKGAAHSAQQRILAHGSRLRWPNWRTIRWPQCCADVAALRRCFGGTTRFGPCRVVSVAARRPGRQSEPLGASLRPFHPRCGDGTGHGCGAAVDAFGDHYAACTRTGLLARRAVVLEQAWVRVAREAVGPEGRVVPQQWRAHTRARRRGWHLRGTKPQPQQAGRHRPRATQPALWPGVSHHTLRLGAAGVRWAVQKAAASAPSWIQPPPTCRSWPGAVLRLLSVVLLGLFRGGRYLDAPPGVGGSLAPRPFAARRRRGAEALRGQR